MKVDSLKTDSSRHIHLFTGSIGVTDNGISFIPSFSLEKPALTTNLSIGRRRFSFDPEFNFSLEGKPWYFLFWFRYKLVTDKRFTLSAGTHLGLNFRNEILKVNGDSAKAFITERYVVAEVVPSYAVTKNIRAGAYYIFSKGLDKGTVNTTHFATLNTVFSNVEIAKQFYLRIAPQVYFLRQAERNGFFASTSLTLNRANVPVSLSALASKSIHSDIIGSRNFVWNLTLTYSFGKRYYPL